MITTTSTTIKCKQLFLAEQYVILNMKTLHIKCYSYAATQFASIGLDMIVEKSRFDVVV